MSKREFTEEEIKELSNNPYIKHVGSKGITYMDEFKIHFIEEKNKGKTTTEIFKNAGFDTKIIGRKRMDCFSDRIMKKGINNVKDMRKGNSGRPKEHPDKELTPEETIKLLKHQNALLEQENEFLKKMKFLAEKQAWMKSIQKKNTK